MRETFRKLYLSLAYYSTTEEESKYKCRYKLKSLNEKALTFDRPQPSHEIFISKLVRITELIHNISGQEKWIMCKTMVPWVNAEIRLSVRYHYVAVYVTMRIQVNETDERQCVSYNDKYIVPDCEWSFIQEGSFDTDCHRSWLKVRHWCWIFEFIYSSRSKIRKTLLIQLRFNPTRSTTTGTLLLVCLPRRGVK